MVEKKRFLPLYFLLPILSPWVFFFLSFVLIKVKKFSRNPILKWKSNWILIDIDIEIEIETREIERETERVIYYLCRYKIIEG